MGHAVVVGYLEELIMRGTILAAVLLAASAGGCYVSGETGYQATYSGGAYVESPDLVAVSPGVQVVADYDEPVFYSDGFYWRFNDGFWYRSNSYYTGWYYYERPPAAVLRIDRPYAYRHYRPAGYVARSRGTYRRPEPVYRDHRGPGYRDSGYRQPPPAQSYRSSPPPAAAPYRSAPPPAAQRSTPERSSAPVVRDHRSSPPPAAAREERVRERDHRH